MRDSTLGEYLRALRCLDELCCPASVRVVDRTMGKRFVQGSTSGGLSESTVNTHLSSLRRVWNDLDGLATNPFNSKRKGGVRRFKVAAKDFHLYKPEEIKKVLDACPDDRWAAMVLLAFSTGLRRGEIENLTWQDVDLPGGEVLVNPKVGDKTVASWTPKDKDRRRLPMTGELKTLLARLFMGRDLGNPYVVVSSVRAKAIKAHLEAGTWKVGRDLINNFTRRYTSILTAAGVAIDEFHSLRKTCVTNWLMAKVAPHEVQRLAGHASVETTIKFYSKVDVTAIDRAREAGERFATRLGS